MVEVESPEPAAPERPDGGSVLELLHSGEKVRLDLFLCQALPGRSRSFIQKLIDGRCVEILGSPAGHEPKPASLLAPGTRVRVTFPPIKPSELHPQDIPLRIIYECDEFAVIDKPAGIVMHPSAHQDQGTLVNGLLFHLKRLSGIGGEYRPGIVHRLDKDTSGVLLVAKNDVAHQALSSQFKERRIQKVYTAILRGEWTAREGSISLPIGRSIVHRKRMMVRTDGLGKEALTSYRIVEAFDGYALAEVSPHTGRTHQIRVHMAKIRLPVACDPIYGREQRIGPAMLRRQPATREEAPLIARHALHASRIRFFHPLTGEVLTFESPLPDDMAALLDGLRRYRPLRA
jgi:23S rRNA pseudouridine1911/1915/1917 synthase